MLIFNNEYLISINNLLKDKNALQDEIIKINLVKNYFEKNLVHLCIILKQINNNSNILLQKLNIKLLILVQ